MGTSYAYPPGMAPVASVKNSSWYNNVMPGVTSVDEMIDGHVSIANAKGVLGHNNVMPLVAPIQTLKDSGSGTCSPPTACGSSSYQASPSAFPSATAPTAPKTICMKCFLFWIVALGAIFILVSRK